MRTLTILSTFIIAVLTLSCQSGFTRITVPDLQNKRIWQAEDGGQMTWNQASRYCRELTLDGKSDWRLPDMDELEAAYPLKSEFSPPASGSYWSSDIAGRSRAGYVKFDFGVTGYRKKTYSASVRCVRPIK